MLPSLTTHPPFAADTILDEMVESVICIDLDGMITFWNRGAENLYGYSTDEAVGRHFSVLYPVAHGDEENRANHFAPQVLTAKHHEIDGWRIRKSGEQVFIHLSAMPLCDAAGNQVGIIDYSIDITGRKAAEQELAKRDEELRQQNMLNQALLDAQSQAGIGLFILQDGRIAFANPAASRITGYSNDELLTLANFMRLIHPDECERLLHKYPSLQEGVPFPPEGEAFEGRHDLTIQTLSGEYRVTEISVATIKGTDNPKILVVMVDISERKLAEERLQHLALHDPLTGLSNRTLIFDRIGSTIAAAKRNKTSFALFFLDLDNFKPINDAYGHDAGDIALQAVADRLRTCVRESDTVGRVGGDEFVLLIRDVAGRKTAESVAAKVTDALSAPFAINDQNCQIGTSVGIVIYPEHGADADTLMQHADAAMYSAKRLGKNRCVVWPG